MNKSLVYFLIKLKNASKLKKEFIVIEYNVFHITIIQKLYEEGFIQSFSIFNKQNFNNNSCFVLINLRFFLNKPVLGTLNLLSTPSLKNILTVTELYRIKSLKYTVFLTTSLGILTLNECKKKNLGGEALFIC